VTYARLSEHFQRIGHLEHVGAIVGWDEAVMMSRSGGRSRAEAQAALGVLVHQQRIDARIPSWLDAAEAEELDPASTANVREIRRAYTRATAVDSDLVAQLSRASSACEQGWREQRANNDWQGHRPLLEEVVRLTRIRAGALGDALSLSPYDALLDGFEPGMRSAAIDPLFAELGASLPDLLTRIRERQSSEQVVIPDGPFEVEAQRALGLSLMAAVGFDFDRGRLDVSHHPFCGGVPDDVRITTRYDPGDFTSAMMGVLHETGHAKYEQGLPAALAGQPAGAARSMAVHESQSLLTEMQVCRGEVFVRAIAPRLREAFPARAAAQPEAFDADNLVRLYSRVAPGLIRVDADEVTYPLHVVLRYRIERQLIAGEIEVGDLPELWDAGMRELLGLSTGDDYGDGCMQDVHWASGAFGYFPTYTLGALLAAQLFAAARGALPGLDDDIAGLRLAELDAWLRDRVWQQGSVLETPELVRHATGAALSAAPFLEHLRARYLPG